MIYSRNSNDVEKYPTPGRAIYKALKNEYGEDRVHHDEYAERARINQIRMLGSDDRITSESEMLESIPQLMVDRVYIVGWTPQLGQRRGQVKRDSRWKV